jgi:hypothetical protein
VTCRPEGPGNGKLGFTANQRKRGLFGQCDRGFFVRRDLGMLGIDLRKGLAPDGSRRTKSCGKKHSASGISHRRLQSKRRFARLVTFSLYGNEFYHKEFTLGNQARNTRNTDRPA